MGNCCTWKSGLEGAGEMQMKSQNYSIEHISSILNHDRTSNMFKISAFMNDKENIPDFIYKQQLYYKNLNDIISSSNTNKISTINLESLWNITKYYKQDFTNCSYILYDLRKKEKKTENFLKKYKCINYNIAEIQTFSGNKLRIFRNFIKNKNIIIIPEKYGIGELKKISDFIDSINDESLQQQKFYILEDLLNIKDEEIPEYFYNYKLYQKFDEKDFEIYPNILFSLNKIKYLNNYNYIFIQEKEMESSTYLSNKDFLHFMKSMNIKLILDLDESYKNEEGMEKIILEEITNIGPTLKSVSNSNNTEILHFKINSKDYFNNKLLKKFLFHLRFCFLSQGTLLIFYSDGISNQKELSKWISFVLTNSFFIYDEEGIMLTESEILVKNIQGVCPIYLDQKFVVDSIFTVIEENYSSKDYNSEPYDSKQTNIIQGVKNLWQVKKEKNVFFEIICVIERMILNIVLNPQNEKYYKIKKSSRTIQTLIINIPEANYLFQMIGFKIDSNDEFYSIDKKTDIRKIEEIHKFLLFAVNKIINDPDF